MFKPLSILAAWLLVAIGAMAQTSESGTPSLAAPLSSTGTTVEHWIKPSGCLPDCFPATGEPRRSKTEARTVPPANTMLFGSVIGHSGTPTTTGLYLIPTDGSPLTANNRVYPHVLAELGGVAIDNTYWTIKREVVNQAYVVRIESYSILTGEKLSSEVGAMQHLAFDLAYNPIDGKVYGCFFDKTGNRYEFGSIDFKTLERTTISSLTNPWNSCAFDAEGQLYAMDMKGNFFKVDYHNGEMTSVGFTGYIPRYISSGTIELSTGRYFTTMTDAQVSYLLEIDKATGEATIVTEFDRCEEITGLTFTGKNVESAAPAKVENLQISFSGSSLTGTVAFKNPTLTYDGTPLQGELYYIIEVGDSVYDQAIAMPGSEITAEITLPNSGPKLFCVYCTNKGGEGQKTNKSVYVGNGTPRDPSNVKLTYADSKATISWNAVTSASDGGYVNKDDVEYIITRMPENKVVGNLVKGTTFEDTFVEPSDKIVTLYYTVTTSLEGKQSQPVNTNKKRLGHAFAPYYNDFGGQGESNAYAIEKWKMIDVKGDGRGWRFFSGNMFCDGTNNDSIPNDDWLISEPIRLEAGKFYAISYNVASTNVATQMHRYEVKCGREQTIEAMTTTVQEAKVIHYAEAVCEGGEIVPTETGDYYIGFHCTSDPNANRVIIYDVTISEGNLVTAPMGITDLEVTPDSQCRLEASIKCTLPDKCFNGDKLTTIKRLEIYRNDSIIKTYTNLTPGQVFTWTDNEGIVNGENTYTVMTVNDKGSSPKASKTVFVGIKSPAKVENAKIVADPEHPGMVTVSWDPPTTDYEGNPIPANMISYCIQNVDKQYITIADNYKDTSITFRACEEEGQHLVVVTVQSITAGGKGPVINPPSIFIGDAYETPLVESFANGRPSIDMLYDPLGTHGNASCVDDATFNGITSFDGDNGFIIAGGQTMGDKTAIQMGKVKLDNKRPVFSIYIWGIKNVPAGRGTSPNNSEVALQVFDKQADNWITLDSVVVKNLEEKQWNLLSASLDAYKGQELELRILATKKTYLNTNYTYMDRMFIGTIYEINAGISAVDAPDRVLPDEPFSISPTIENKGLSQIGLINVELLHGSEVIETRSILNLEPIQKRKISFTTQLGKTEKDDHTYTLRIVTDNDEYAPDNVVTIPLSVTHPTTPTVTGLEGVQHKHGGAALTWNAPVLSTEIKNVQETFEETMVGSSYLEGWTFIDADGYPCGGITGIDIPGFLPAVQAKSFMIFDSSLAPGNTFLEAAGGTRCMISMFCAYGKQSDDWAISPLLSGRAQTVSVMAKSAHPNYPETMEILYSTTTPDPKSFISARKVEKMRGTWSEYSVSLPAGAKYMAIRSLSKGGVMLMVDDIKYEAASQTDALQLMGYHIYRDGERITAAPVPTPDFHDQAAVLGTHTYHVSAVYGTRESRLAGPVNVTVSKVWDSVDGIEADPLSDPDAKVYTPQGIRVEMPLQPGLYIVVTKHGSRKIVVQ